MGLQKLKSMRQQKRYSCQYIADHAGISKEYYWMIENGKRRLSYELAVKIAKVFETSPDEIFLESELTTCEQNAKKEVS